MTFDLSSEQQATRDRATTIARERIAPLAVLIDEEGQVPPELLHEVGEAGVLTEDGLAVTLVVVLEELATASASVALAAALGTGGDPDRRRRQPDGGLALSGLRGAWIDGADEKRGRLVMAAIALGIGRAAIEAALAIVRGADPRAAQENEKPYWVVSDAATEVDAARLLTLRAAQALDRASDAATEIAMAKLLAAGAAERAVVAALRISGPEGYVRGALLERLTRDARAVALLLGTEEDQRAEAAAGLLPEA